MKPNKIVRLINQDPELRQKVIDQCTRDGDPLTAQAINEWRKLKKGVPPARVLSVAKALGKAPHEIRPDIFPTT
jgi:hypothetical protein